MATLIMPDPGLVRFKKDSIQPNVQALRQGRPGDLIGIALSASLVFSELANQTLDLCHRYFSGPRIKPLVSLPNKG